MSSLTEGYTDGFTPMEATVESTDLGIPSEIQIIAPEIPDVRVIHDIPAMIQVIAPEIPTEIKVTGLELIPREIRVLPPEQDMVVKLDATEMPKTVTLDASDVPTVIKLQVDENFPKTILLDASQVPDKIQVVGIPPAIEIIGNIPTEIQLKMPENPEIEMVYKGAPLELKITLDTSKLTGEGETAQCVAIVPCKPN